MTQPDPSEREDREDRRRVERREAEDRADREDDSVPSEARALMRMVDFRIPLVWLLGGFIMAVSILTSMYFQQQKTTEALTELQSIVRASNAQTVLLAGDLALVKYRLDNIEKIERESAARRFTNENR